MKEADDIKRKPILNVGEIAYIVGSSNNIPPSLEFWITTIIKIKRTEEDGWEYYGDNNACWPDHRYSVYRNPEEALERMLSMSKYNIEHFGKTIWQKNKREE